MNKQTTTENSALSFEDFKKLIITKAKVKKACSDEYKRALLSENWQQLLQVIKDNARWCYNEGVATTDTMLLVPESELIEANIFVKKENVEQRGGIAHYYSSTSKHYDSSTSKHYGSSTSEHYDSSTSKHYGSSYSTIYEYGKYISISDNSICLERSTGKIYLSNKKIEIVYV